MSDLTSLMYKVLGKLPERGPTIVGGLLRCGAGEASCDPHLAATATSELIEGGFDRVEAYRIVGKLIDIGRMSAVLRAPTDEHGAPVITDPEARAAAAVLPDPPQVTVPEAGTLKAVSVLDQVRAEAEASEASAVAAA